MIAHRFLDRDELVTWLCKDKDCDETKAKALVQQVESRDYNPPSRQRILEWQAEQDFPICPTPDDPNACNPYRELQMPEEVLEDIEEFREQQFEAEEARSCSAASVATRSQSGRAREDERPPTPLVIVLTVHNAPLITLAVRRLARGWQVAA